MTEDRPTTPEDIVKRLIELIYTGRQAEALDLYADDVEIAIPFALPTSAVIRGKQVLVDLMERSPEPLGTSRMYRDIVVRDLVVHKTADPAIVVAEWTYVTTVGAETVENGNIIVVECRDGRIVRSRDYHDEIRRAIADGRASGLAGAIDRMTLDQDR